MTWVGCVDNYVERYVGLVGWSCEGMLASQVRSLVGWFLFLQGRKRGGERPNPGGLGRGF